ncbi:MAG: orotate phosphoribosyltransferase [Candidatus Altiarchaeum hamiconexum]|uniref:Orotate phosphoribosyltransferase n=1 Tax=Candidatus Altarchaeum hamiconexum TaxID=1803513 RepID=A0A8J7YVG1_9ARCH|nr:orotate phosphoribosyltransferase [Candidatus Altarchaeum hamiconexum]NCS91867.1 orotate phosphoribosyltransferase [Candidatus Altarchaeum hamiconexum]NCT00861.1 orotate phosphoribosyltransferase [Candidatus Altarchaeum hamiconexum]PIV28312.1 MAG: orotate phosphoribosyltransferase [Candidatus Altarchaeum sp. CG03_land_8_20_14_0_80_32_618]
MDAQKKKRLIELIKEKALVVNTEENFKLASGKESSYYFNMKPVALDPEGANLITEVMLEIIMVQCKDVAYVGGMETGGFPLVAAICVQSKYRGMPVQGFFVRKEEKKRGTKKLIEGNLKENSNVVLVEDVTTTGASVLKAVNAVREFNCVVDKVITIVDRLEGAKENLAKEGISLISLLTVDAFKENLAEQ